MARDFLASGWPPMIGRHLTIPEWHRYIQTYEFGRIPPKRLVLHHTHTDAAMWRGEAAMRGLQAAYHARGWSSAPHLYAAPDGIWLFTPMRDVGLHAGLGNSGWSGGIWWYSIGLVLVGSFDDARPEGAVWEHAKAVMIGLAHRLKIPLSQLLTLHRDYTSYQSCPGWAITIPWLLAEVSAQAILPPIIPEHTSTPIKHPDPPTEQLLHLLLDQSYARRASGYFHEWSFHHYAIEHTLGMPVGTGGTITVDGRVFRYQPFARDTLYHEIPRWGDIHRLSTAVRGTIPSRGIGRRLLEETYHAGGATLHPSWPLHRYAVQASLGPPLGERSTIRLHDTEYAYQVFALDTLYSPIPRWNEVHQLNRLTNARNTPSIALREALLAATYRHAGATYHPEWHDHQCARLWYLGSPLSDAYRVLLGDAHYLIQVYALDTLYHRLPYWGNAQRLLGLLQQHRPRWKHIHTKPFPAISLSRYPNPTTSNPDDQLTMTSPIIQHIPAAASLRPRRVGRINAIVLHGDPDPATQTIAEMTTIGTTISAHYYLTIDGIIYQLLDERYAAQHSGLAFFNGLFYDLDDRSIGIILERPTTTIDAPATPPTTTLGRLSIAFSQRVLPHGKELFRPFQERQSSTHPMDSNRIDHVQQTRLQWLVQMLLVRYQLPPDAVVRWEDVRFGWVTPQMHSRASLKEISLSWLQTVDTHDHNS